MWCRDNQTSFQRGSVAKHLKEIDPALYDHLRVTNAFDEGIPYNRYISKVTFHTDECSSDAIASMHAQNLQVVWSMFCL